MKLNRNIPAELKRDVLIESGHRCAIPTCKHPTVEIHHIVPWADCQEHKFENLIALCPNCHRRAHSKEIDRKSLSIYKEKLSQFELIKSPVIDPPVSEELNSSSGIYEVIRFEESSDEDICYKINISYPKFSIKFADNVSDINNSIYQIIFTEITQIRSWASFSMRDLYGDDFNSSRELNLSASFNITYESDKLLSIYFTFSSYTGGAHSNRFTKVLNLQLSPVRSLDLYTIFKDGTLNQALAQISDYCISEHRKTHPEYKSDDSSRGFDVGLDPQKENYQKFNVMGNGLLFSFDEYQIGCFAEGRTQIIVPYYIIDDFLNSFCHVSILSKNF